MIFSAIKLNPSQELKLAKAATDFLGPGGPLSLDKKSGLVRQQTGPGQPIFLRPMLCIMPDGFSEEEFLSIQKFEICLEREKNLRPEEPACFWAKIWTRPRFLVRPIPFALGWRAATDFSLEKVFLAARDRFSFTGMDAENDAGETVLRPSSFKFCRAEISEREWKLFDELWKKL